MVTRAPRLLVKSMQMPQGAAFNVGKVPFTLHPLFPGHPRTGAVGAAPASEWHLTDIPTDVNESDLWDLCHQLQTKGFGIAGSPTIEFAEPDLEQQWIVDSPDRLAAKALAGSASGDRCRNPGPPNSRYPSPSPFDWRWFQDPHHSGSTARVPKSTTPPTVSPSPISTPDTARAMTSSPGSSTPPVNGALSMA